MSTDLLEPGNNGKATLEELRNAFVVDEDLVASRLSSLVEKAKTHCHTDRHGNIRLVAREQLSARRRVLLVLCARTIAARLFSDVSEDVSLAELSEFTGLPKDQVSARCGELLKKERWIDSSRRGTYRMLQDRVERFLDSLSTGD